MTDAAVASCELGGKRRRDVLGAASGRHRIPSAISGELCWSNRVARRIGRHRFEQAPALAGDDLDALGERKARVDRLEYLEVAAHVEIERQAPQRLDVFEVVVDGAQRDAGVLARSLGRSDGRCPGRPGRGATR